MSESRAEQVKQILERASELSVEERESYLESACAGDEALRGEVEQLLAFHDSENGFLEDSPLEVDLHAFDQWTSPDELLVGECIDGWRLDRVLASGGMGTVYEAVSVQGDRKAALKIIRPGLTSPVAMRRFAFEAETLSRLRHPNIARILEVGTHEEGGWRTPFFVMEHIHGGKPITEGADERKLNLSDRLELFAQVCDAVHHGHQKGVVHRDLKPGNILIDGEGNAKIIDFGVARSTDADVTAATRATSAGELIGTLQYMSPEQCGTDPGAVDTRSDVYSLGVVLYELVCGSLPYDVQEAGVLEAVRLVREQSPRPPRESLASLPADVETIILKALEKEPDRRYASASSLAADIRRFLQGAPIEARRASAAYLIGKFTRRHKGITSTALASAVATVGALVAVSIAWAGEAEQRRLVEKRELEVVAALDESERQRQIARAVQKFLNGDILNETTAILAPEEVSLLDVLNAASEGIEDRFEDPAAAGAVHHAVGAAFGEVGKPVKAEVHLQRALILMREELGETDPNVLLIISHLGKTLNSLGRHDEALEHLERAAEIWRSKGEDLHNEQMRHCYSNLGVTYWQLGRYDEAAAIFTRIVDVSTRHLGAEHEETLHAQINLAAQYEKLGRLEEAKDLYERVLASSREALGPDHQQTLSAMSNLGVMLYRQGNYDQAAEIYHTLVDVYTRRKGPDHPKTRNAKFNLAAQFQGLGQLDEAEEILEQVIASGSATLGEDHPTVLTYLNNYATLLKSRSRHDEALELHKRVLEARRRRLGPTHFATISSLINVAGELYSLEELDESEVFARQALEAVDEEFGRQHFLAAGALIRIAYIQGQRSDHDQAETTAQEAVEICRAILGPGDVRLGFCLHVQGASAMKQGGHERAEVALLEAYGIFEDLFGQDASNTRSVASDLVELYTGWDRPLDAASWRGRSAGDE